jgi:uncharacterized membrane protein
LSIGNMDVSAPLSSSALAIPTLQDLARRAWAYTHTPRFGNAVIVAFFLAQALDGALTYVGVTVLGRSIEGNPLLFWLMGAAGQGAALAVAKLSAAGFGIVLHLASVHRAVAALTLLYISAAVVPWISVLAMLIGRGML